MAGVLWQEWGGCRGWAGATVVGLVLAGAAWAAAGGVAVAVEIAVGMPVVDSRLGCVVVCVPL